MKTIIIFILASFNLFAQETDLEDLQKEALSFVHSFQKDYNKYLSKKSPNISLRMVSEKELLFEDSVASCERTPKLVILVKKEVWMDASPEKREYMLLHQLGHCLLNRTHNDESIRNIPLSIMAKHNKAKHFTKYRDHYIKELFTKEHLSFMEHIVNER